MASAIPVQTGLFYWPHRSLGPRTAVTFAQNFEATGVVDYFWCIDAVAGWFPPSVWDTDFTPLAALGDFDSQYDAFSTVSMAAAGTKTLGTLVSTNAVRHGPAEIMQTAMTLADTSMNGTIISLGAGEAYNMVPFGYNRKIALARLEDHLRIYRLLWEAEGGISYEGRNITFDQAYIGTVRGRRPQFWAMGAGPKLQRLAGKYADGWMTSVPGAIPNPDEYAKCVQAIKRDVEDAGRDPEAFRFGIMPCILLHDDPEVIERAVEAPIIRFFCALFGRANQAEWEGEGMESPFPPDWNYSFDYFPMTMSRSEVTTALSRTTREAVYTGWYTGSAKEIAVKLQDYIDAGCNFIAPYDFLPAGIGEFTEILASIDRQVDLCRLLKGDGTA